MRLTRIGVFVLLGVAVAAAAFGGYWYAHRQMAAGVTPATAHGGEAAATPGGRKVLYWHDPMYPQQRFDKPGKSPFMDMDLVPVYADEAGGASTVRIDPALTQSLGVRTVQAEIDTFWRRVDTFGTVQADERRISVLQSRAAGWLEKLHLRAENDPVARGRPVAEIYAPELLAAQEEYLLLRASPASGDALVAAARQRLSLLGLSEAQIAALEASGEPTRRVVLHAPASGVVTAIGAREGAAVSPGMPIVSIVDLSRVWIVAEVPEMQLDWIATGRPAQARIAALPGKTFEGAVEYIYPEVNPVTRTVRVRFSVRNQGQALRPGMVADVTLYGGAKREVLLVPSEAVIRTGTRSVVIVEAAPGRFRAQEVATGLTSGERTEITAGLAAGERVVVSGEFLIDSEASLKGAVEGLSAGAAGEEPAGAKPAEHAAQGTVKRIDAEAGTVVIAHDPVPSLDWPSMTMGFRVRDRSLLGQLKPGQAIEFRFVEGDEDYELVAANPSGGAR